MTDPTSDRLGFYVSRLARQMQARFEEGLRGSDLTRLGAMVLIGVGDEEITAPSELASWLGVTRPALSRLLRGLEERGLLQRKADGGDGRARKIVLTPQGAAFLVQVRQATAAFQAHFGRKLSDQDLAELKRLMFILSQNEPDLGGF